MANDLSHVADHTARLVATARTLDDVASASLCEGWTRGHVLTHVARNAEAIGRLVQWASTGEPQQMYPGGTRARDADIAAGATRPLPELVDDLVDTAESLAARLEELSGPLTTDRVQMRGGLEVEARSLPFLRLREVVFHHVDLDAGFTFEDVDEDLVRRFLQDAVTRLDRHPDAPRLELRSTAGDAWTVAAGGGLGEGTTGEEATLGAPTVSGTLGGLLLWLARRDPTGVHADGELPELPRGA